MSRHSLIRPGWVENPGYRTFILDVFGHNRSNMEDLLQQTGLQDITSGWQSLHVSTLHLRSFFETTPENAWQLFQHMIAVADRSLCDVSVLPATMEKKRLLVCDMDSTIVQSETLDDMADKAGFGEKVKAITNSAMQGEIDFIQALEQRVALFAGLNESLLSEVASECRFTPGANTLLDVARENNIRTVLVSGGFEPVVKHVADKLGFDHYVCNYMDVTDHVLTGKVTHPIVDSRVKLQVLEEECQALKLTHEQVCSIGDGANDLSMLQAASPGVAYYGKPLLKTVLPYQINHTDLATVIPMLGV